MSRIRSRLWDAQRFALLPPKLVRRLTNRHQPRVLVVSLPKAGTHLVERALLLHSPLYRALLPTLNEENLKDHGGLQSILARMRPGQVLVSHLPFRPEWHSEIRNMQVKTVFMKRDPRDIIVSNMFYLKKRTDHRLHKVLADQTTDRDRLRLLVNGQPNLEIRGIDQVLSRFEGWLHVADSVIAYEDLIGPRGGGEKERQAATIRTLFADIDLSVPEGMIARTLDGLFSSASPTYRKGTIGQWQEFLDEELVEDLWNLAGDLFAAYGYRLDT